MQTVTSMSKRRPSGRINTDVTPVKESPIKNIKVNLEDSKMILNTDVKGNIKSTFKEFRRSQESTVFAASECKSSTFNSSAVKKQVYNKISVPKFEADSVRQGKKVGFVEKME